MKKVLILCTGNSCRSQMAEGILKSLGNDVIVESAGTRPTERVNPNAVEVMCEIGIDITGNRPKNVELFLDQNWDYVITVCGGAKESCPAFPGNVGKRMHIDFEDPDGQGIEKFREVRGLIRKEFVNFYLREIRGLQLPKCACEE